MRHVACAGVLLLLTSGCVKKTPDPIVSQPPVVESQPDTPPPAAKPVPGSTTAAVPQPAPAAPAPSGTTTPPPAGKPTAPGSTTAAAPQPPPAAPAPSGPTTPPPAGKPAAPAARPPVAQGPTPAARPVAAPPSPAAPAPLDLKALTAQLKATKAIGVFTKLSLKNKVDDLLQQFREHHDGKLKPTTAELRQGYNLLMMKVLSLLQDDDQKLASDIVASREAIWSLLANPQTFATLQT